MIDPQYPLDMVCFDTINWSTPPSQWCFLWKNKDFFQLNEIILSINRTRNIPVEIWKNIRLCRLRVQMKTNYNNIEGKKIHKVVLTFKVLRWDVLKLTKIKLEKKIVVTDNFTSTKHIVPYILKWNLFSPLFHKPIKKLSYIGLPYKFPNLFSSDDFHRDIKLLLIRAYFVWYELSGDTERIVRFFTDWKDSH